MYLRQAAENLGASVVYTSHEGAKPEDGVITGVGEEYVFVLYRGDSSAKATHPHNLEFAFEALRSSP